jgi:hypothetical protein
MPRLPLCVLSLVTSAALAAPRGISAWAQKGSAPLLPGSFSGWSVTSAPPPSKDAANFDVLKEDGISRSEAATYSSGRNRLSLQAWQFGDATGAYGAFTFYRQPRMHAQKLGQEGAAAGDHFVFWSGATVVDATFSPGSKNEPEAMASLAALLPRVSGGASVPPSLPRYLPASDLEPSTVHYAIGPAAYAKSCGAMPASDIGFSQDAEVITAQYGPAAAPGTLTLVMYPTPQMAEAHLKAIETAAQHGHGIGGLARRSGPLLAVVSGNLPAPKAQQLLDAIRFSDTVTINHPEGYVSEGAKLYRLLMGITMLTVILVCSAVLLGFFLGGGRALLRMLRGKPVSSVSEEEFISLHLGN